MHKSEVFVNQKHLWITLSAIFVLTAFINIYVGAILAIFYLLLPGINKNSEIFVILLFLGSCFFATDTRGPLSHFGDFRFLVLGIGLLLIARQKKHYKFPLFYVLPFAFYAIILSIFSPSAGYEQILSAAMFIFVPLMLFVLIKTSVKKSPYTTQTILVTFLLLFFFTNLILIFLPMEGIYLVGRFRGLMGNPNELGLIAMMSYGLIHYIQKKGETDLKLWFFMWSKILLVFLIILTGSRTALFGILLYEMIYRFFNSKPKMIISTAVFGTAFYLLMDIGIVEMIEVLGLSEQLRAQDLITASGRTEVWQVAWEEIRAYPIFGYGMGYDNTFIKDYASLHIGDNPARHWNAIWNSYLSLLLNVGVIGFILYFLFIYKLFAKSFHRRTATAFMAMALFAGITESWMISAVNAFTPIFFVYWALQSNPQNLDQ